MNDDGTFASDSGATVWNSSQLTNLVNLALCWILVFGKFGLPAMGAAGAALALTHVPVREIYQEYQAAVERSGSVKEILKPDSFVLKAPVNGDAVLSAHLRLLQDSVVALARQERTTPQVA